MADLCCEYAIAGITINDDTVGADRLVLGEDGITGLDGAPIRAEFDPQGQSDGGLVHPKFFHARVITFKGFLDIQTVDKGISTAFFSAINAVEAAVVAALEGILNTPSPLAWTPVGQGAKTLTVTYGIQGGEIQFTGPMLNKEFTFTLIAADPDIP